MPIMISAVAIALAIQAGQRTRIAFYLGGKF